MAKKILIVDDDMVSLRLIAYAMQREGYEVFTAPGGREALELLATRGVDLVILDIMMPHMDGYEVCRRLRENPETARLPIILLTAKSQVEDKVKGFNAGADDYVTKPVLPAELVARVRALMQRSGYFSPSPIEVKAKFFAFFGAKGGVGTTTLAVNVAVALAEQSKAVILFDLNVGAGSAALQLGLKPNDALIPLLNVNGEKPDSKLIAGALLPHSSGLRVLPAPMRTDVATLNLTPERVKLLLHELRGMAEYVVVDLGCCMSPVCLAGIAEADRLMIVTESDYLALELFQHTAEAVGRAGVRGALVEAVMVNRVRSATVISKSEAEQKLEHKIAGFIIPAPEMCFQANRNRIPIVMSQPGNVTVEQIRELAEHLVS